MICKNCNKDKVRIKVITKSPHKYYNEKGQRWRSKTTCPDCNRQMESLKAKVVYKDTFTKDIPEYHITRKCRRCEGNIELSRWWTCESCKPELGDDGDGKYCYITKQESTEFKISELKLLAGGLI